MFKYQMNASTLEQAMWNDDEGAAGLDYFDMHDVFERLEPVVQGKFRYLLDSSTNLVCDIIVFELESDYNLVKLMYNV